MPTLSELYYSLLPQYGDLSNLSRDRAVSTLPQYNDPRLLRGSWYSQLPFAGFVDRQDKPGSNALGVPDWQQGIALPSRRGLGQWYNVTPPGEKIPYPTQQSDVGPAPWTGKGVDISAALANQMGYTPKDFPTGGTFAVEPRDEPRALGSPAGLPYQAGEMPEGAIGDAVAGPSGGQRKMPSLWEMMTGGGGGDQGGAATPTWDQAFAQNRNSLVGLGLGLASGGLQGALQGYGQGSQTDAVTQYRNALMKQHADELAFRKAEAQRQAGQWTQQFQRGGITEAQKAAADLGLKSGTPEHADFMKQYYQPKTEDWSIHSDPNTDQQYLFNKRTLETKPMQVPGAPGGPWQTGQGGAVPYLGTPSSAVPAPAAPAFPGSTVPSADIPVSGGVPGGPSALPVRTGPKAFEPEQKLRKEAEDVAKPYIVARQNYQKLMASQDSAAGDLALIYGYMRMLDPTSTVREGEFATAQNSGGIPDMVRNMYNRAISGERLNPQQREGFKGQATSLYDTYRSQYEPRMQQYGNIARQYRIDPSRVIPDLGPEPTAPERKAPPEAVSGRGVPQKPVAVTSPAEARKLPSGTRIVLPDGRTGTVP